MNQVIFRLFPSLVGKAPALDLCDLPTPLEKMEHLGRRIGHGGLWVKRDDLTSRVYGGNKARKLDFILADARRRGEKALLAIGALGSHHVLATCIHAGRLGFETGALQFPVPSSPHARRNQAGIDARARWRIDIPSPLLVPYGIGRWRMRCLADGFFPGETRVIAPGGSEALGCLGYVNSALEIDGQRRSLGLPPFDAACVPLGSCGTFAGLALGFALAGAPTRVIGVRIISALAANGAVAAHLVLRTLRFLGGGAALSRARTARLLLAIPSLVEKRYVGEGYAIAGREEQDAIRLLRDTEGLSLDPFYAAKAMRAFLELARRRAGKRLLFILTSPAPL